MALGSLQIRQIGAIIDRALKGQDTNEFTRDLDTAVTTFQRSVTRDTTRLYECTGDPYQCHLRVHLAVTKMFHIAVPLIMNGYLWDPLGVKLVNRFFKLEEAARDSRIFHDLIREVARNPKSREAKNFIKVQSAESMNYGFFEYYRDEDIPDSLASLLFGLARLRLSLLSKLGWRGLTRIRQHGALLKDVSRGLFLKTFFSRSKLRESSLVRKLFPVCESERSQPELARGAAQPVRNLLS